MTYAQSIVSAYDVSEDLANAIVSTADAVKADPGYLADLINYETAGTFSPSIQNPNSSATGLIQFLSSTAKGLGTTTAELADMTAVDQMQYVQAYLEGVQRTYGPLSAESDLYMAVFYPKAIGQGMDYSFGSAVTAVNASNKVSDYVSAVRRKSKLGKLLPSSTRNTGVAALLILVGAAALAAAS